MRLRNSLLFVCLFACSDLSQAGQLASMVRDLRTTAVGGRSLPHFLGFAADIAYFSAETPSIGRELWRTDGTSEGTRLVADGCPGECDKHFTTLAQAEDRLFLASSPYAGSFNVSELLVATSDPSSVQVILASSGEVNLSSLLSDGGTALLGEELVFWTSDFSGAAQIYSARGPGSELTSLARFEGTAGLGRLQRSGPLVYFWSYPYGAPAELWATDGTASGTHRVATLDVQSEVAVQVSLGAHSLLFAAQDPNGSEIWISDGTSPGTRPLSSFADPDATIWTAAASPNRAYFFVDDASFGQELWTTDGTSEGTHAVTSFGFHAPFGSNYSTDQLIVAGDRAYFFATNGIDGVELWVTTASGSSASPLAEVCEESDCFADRWLRSIGTQVFFQDEDPEHGFEIWTTDGSASGTHILDDSCPGSCGGFGNVLATSAGRLVYSASQGDGNPTTIFIAAAPWVDSTSLFDPLRGAPTLNYYEQGPALDSGELLYFTAVDSLGGAEPWVSRGSPSTSLQLADLWGPVESSSQPRNFVASSGTVAFEASGSDYYYESIWLTQGNSATTREASRPPNLCVNANLPTEALADRFVSVGCYGGFVLIDPATSSVSAIPTASCYEPAAVGVLGGTVAAAFWCGGETQIWRSDGTEAGTAPTLSLPYGFSVYSEFKAVGNHLLVVGGQDEVRLYALSPPFSALVQLTGPDDYFESLIAPENEELAFFSLGSRLWRTDGTPSGTFAVGPQRPLIRLKAAVRSATGYDLVVLNESNYYEVWSTDGTSPGTQFRAAIGPFYESLQPVALDRAGDNLYFFLYSYEAGRTLWTLEDGSSEPHVLNTSASDSSPTVHSLGHHGSRAYFSGCDATHGCELWSTEGTEASTRMLQDIAPGPASSDPGELFVDGSLLYFSADDGLHGFEPWALPLDDGPACRANELNLCLEGGRFQASARWTDFSRHSGDATAVAITPDTGYFWFFDDANVELILKLIDGGGYNGHHWVYYGALSNVEYTFTVTDSETGAAKRYFNPATRFASSGDITAFGPQGAHALGGPAEAMTRAATPPEVSLAAFSAPQGLPGACVPTATRFCILDNRFAVTATWRDFAGHTGTANAGTLTDDTGYLWFFNEANVEVVLKMVDAGTFNQHFWVYYGALSNVEYTLTVTDTVAGGPPRIYHNPLGQFGSFGDIEAFPAP